MYDFPGLLVKSNMNWREVLANRLVLGGLFSRSPRSPNEAVCTRRRFIYIAIPKTGSTGIRQQTKVQGPYLIDAPHLSIQSIRSIMHIWELRQNLGQNDEFPTDTTKVRNEIEVNNIAQKNFETYAKFSIVRNPWARVASMWGRRSFGLYLSMSFDEFCEELLWGSDTCRFPLRQRDQLDWIADDSGKILVDHVLRLESLDKDLLNLREKFPQLSFLRNHVKNKGPVGRPYNSIYNSHTRKLVGEKFARDLEAFGYEY
jgi:hypothetical protein